MGIRDDLGQVLERIERARKKSPFSQSVRLVAVTKGVDPSVIRQVAAEGLQEFGENRVQEAAAKIAELPSLRWHMVGHLQTNKVREAVRSFELIQSVDRLSLAEGMDREAERLNKVAQVLLQVNTQEDRSKFGFLPEVLLPALERLASLRHLNLLGLMTIAPLASDPERCRPCFKTLRSLRERAMKEEFPNCNLSILSMGMSQDFEVAIEEGSTMVRIGTALFGTRSPQKGPGPALAL